jgi:hypothetical protein
MRKKTECSLIADHALAGAHQQGGAGAMTGSPVSGMTCGKIPLIHTKIHRPASFFKAEVSALKRKCAIVD